VREVLYRKKIDEAKARQGQTKKKGEGYCGKGKMPPRSKNQKTNAGNPQPHRWEKGGRKVKTKAPEKPKDLNPKKGGKNNRNQGSSPLGTGSRKENITRMKRTKKKKKDKKKGDSTACAVPGRDARAQGKNKAGSATD